MRSTHWLRRFLAAIFGLSMLLSLHAGAASTPPVLMLLGDSISAGYGLPKGQGWVDLLAQRLQSEGYSYRVVNASITGDTTAGGRARLPALLKQHRPSVVVIELGGNDALRGGDLNATRSNLDAMVSAVKAAAAKPMIVGMQLPPNYGPTYVRAFINLYTEVARQQKVPLVPSMFEGFGEDLNLFQADRIHPVAAAQSRILDNVWPTLASVLTRR